jgi:N-acylneuraminate cytidylyltransferase
VRLAVIPARGGSKRIPRKNVKLFYGKPIIGWSIEAAINSECFDRIIVSTDDKEIADIAKNFGAETPFVRPANLSDDYSGTISVIAHAIEWQSKNGQEASEVCCIYPTAPFIKSADIILGLNTLLNNDASYAFSVTTFDSAIQRAIKINSNNRLEMLSPECFNTRSQDLEEMWHDAGQFYWGKAKAWISGTPIFSKNSIAIKLPRYRVQDIDTAEDWIFAELLFRTIQNME